MRDRSTSRVHPTMSRWRCGLHRSALVNALPAADARWRLGNRTLRTRKRTVRWRLRSWTVRSQFQGLAVGWQPRERPFRRERKP